MIVESLHGIVDDVDPMLLDFDAQSSEGRPRHPADILLTVEPVWTFHPDP